MVASGGLSPDLRRPPGWLRPASSRRACAVPTGWLRPAGCSSHAGGPAPSPRDGCGARRMAAARSAWGSPG
eukprot:10576212-Alexandrium_andersonii.AAC.1